MFLNHLLGPGDGNEDAQTDRQTDTHPDRRHSEFGLGAHIALTRWGGEEPPSLPLFPFSEWQGSLPVRDGVRPLTLTKENVALHHIFMIPQRSRFPGRAAVDRWIFKQLEGFGKIWNDMVGSGMIYAPGW